jgi:hypothetical protein
LIFDLRAVTDHVDLLIIPLAKLIKREGSGQALR